MEINKNCEEHEDKVIEIGKFYGNKSATNYFKKLSKLPKGNIILRNYKQSIKRCAQNKTPFFYLIDISEFKTKHYSHIRKHVYEKYNAFVYLAENMGYKVVNKKDGPIFEDGVIAIKLDISELEDDKLNKKIDNLINLKYKEN